MSCNNCPSKGILDINNQTQNQQKYNKFNAYDWLEELPESAVQSNLVEVRFKNNRKAFYYNKYKLPLKRGDNVAVQCESGHGLGMVSLIGKIAELQLKRKSPTHPPEKIIYRKATKNDIEKQAKAKVREKPTMIKARQLAAKLNLGMKISDVEFQGDGSKAIFYYIADGRIDFRELIKLYANEFGIRIEMKQIGARQESALIGGIGSCGRELCCSSWRNQFESISTTAAKEQQLSHSSHKLTGQCGKLKCCLMYELDQYIEANSDFPDELLQLETEKGIAYPVKKDILKKEILYSIGSEPMPEMVTITLNRAKEIIQMNKKGIKPQSLKDEMVATVDVLPAEIERRSVKTNKPKKKYKKRNSKNRNYKNKKG